jgi:hypothetical protein
MQPVLNGGGLAKMAFAFVNSSAGVTSPAATALPSPAANHTTNNHIVALVQVDTDTAVNSVTDTAGNTYTRVTGRAAGTGGITCGWTEAFLSFNITGNAANVVTANLAASSTGSMHIHQISAAGTVSLETQGYLLQSATLTPTSDSFTNAQANNYVVFFITSALSTNTYTAGTGYTLRASAGGFYQSEDRTDAPSGAQTATITASPTATDFSMVTVSLKEVIASSAVAFKITNAKLTVTNGLLTITN